jgi:3-oxosteroid 1-dehydrogenase
VEQEYDVVVLGTGAAGLTTAVTAAEGGARVGLFEKADRVGGTSAWSGGHVWIPDNPHMAAVGATDSREQARTYILSLSRGLMDERLIDAFLDAGPRMVSFLDDAAGTDFYVVRDFPDYHPERPGGLPKGGRTLECPLFSFHRLGQWAERVNPSPYLPPHIAMSETPMAQAVPTPIPKEERARRAAADERGTGQALIGRLLRACLDRGIEPQLSRRARALVRTGQRVTGVRFEDGLQVSARAGVVLATGGFEWNEEYKRAFLRGPLTHPVSVPENTGDGLHMAMRAGAMLGNMREAWWIPVADLPPGVNAMKRALVGAERGRPGAIMINRKGKRFTNEAANYNAFGGAFHEEDVGRFEYANLPCWLIFDQAYLENYGLLHLRPPAEEAREWLTSGWTLGELAGHLGVPGEALEHTVRRWNANAEAGHDPDFHRGESAFDRWWGDPWRKGEVAGTLGPLQKPPFYALPIESGALGTKGGPKIDEFARVIDLDGEPIPGLYAAGNVMASPFGATYGGAGGTLGPAMVFGFLAGRHATAQDA